jgi:[ribosomal protein S5]-alanine N-acetyltransferase
MMKVIETERLVLRPLEDADAEELFAIYSVPENVTFMGRGSGSVDELRSHISRHIKDHPGPGPGLSAALLKESGEMIGRAGFFFSSIDEKDEIEMAYLIDRTHWGKGYATEASQAILDHGFNDLGLKRIIALIHPLNSGSIRVADKCGFTYERELSNYKDFGNVGLYSKVSPHT